MPMNPPSPGENACRTLSAPRRLVAFSLPLCCTLPCPDDLLNQLALRIGDLLGFDSVTPFQRPLAAQQWMLAFYHGQPTRHRAATYENGHPGAITYTPRNVALIVIDARHRIGYASASKMTRIHALLSALNGLLFPDRPLHSPPEIFSFDLNALRFLTFQERHCLTGQYPWQHLRLKFLTWTEAGTEASSTKHLWHEDGFDALDLDGFTWPLHPLTAGIQCFLPGKRCGYKIELSHHSPHLRATLSPQTLETLAALIRLCAAP